MPNGITIDPATGARIGGADRERRRRHRY